MTLIVIGKDINMFFLSNQCSYVVSNGTSGSRSGG